MPQPIVNLPPAEAIQCVRTWIRHASGLIEQLPEDIHESRKNALRALETAQNYLPVLDN